MSEYRLLPLLALHKDIPDPNPDPLNLEAIGSRVVFAPNVIENNLGARFYFPSGSEQIQKRGLPYFVGRPRQYVNGKDPTGLTYTTQQVRGGDLGWVGIIEVPDEARRAEGDMGYTNEATIVDIAVFCRTGVHSTPETRSQHDVRLELGPVVVDGGGRIFPMCEQYRPTSEREQVSTFQVTDGTLVLAAPEKIVNDVIERINRPLKERRERWAAGDFGLKAEEGPRVTPQGPAAQRPLKGGELRRVGKQRPPRKKK